MGDDATDDHGAISDALERCPAGGTVFLPAGVYRVSRPLTLPDNVRLLGSGSTKYPQYAGMASCLKPYYGRFTGSALLQAEDAHAWSVEALNLLGVAATDTSKGPIDALSARGNCKGVRLRQLTVSNFSGHGVHTRTTPAGRPGGWEVEGLYLHQCRGHGWYGADPAHQRIAACDCRFINCEAAANHLDGWRWDGLTTTSLLGVWSCWNLGDGFHIGQRAANLSLTECQTDRNGRSGFHFRLADPDGSTSPAPRSFMLTACTASRDGRTANEPGARYAAVHVEGRSAVAQAPYVVLSGLNVRVGRDDDGTGLRTPEVGIRADHCRGLLLTGSVVAAVEPHVCGDGGHLYDGGANLFVTVDQRTGDVDYGTPSGREMV